MPRNKPDQLLLKKAAQDEYILDKLVDDHDAADEIFGFHAQQAAEKLLKSALISSGSKYPQSHRLAELLDLARKRGLNLPPEFDDIRTLTPFAVDYRYGDMPEEREEKINRQEIRNKIRLLRKWVERSSKKT